MSNNQLQKLPIQMLDALFFDNAFADMKERFLAHIKRIDEEMNKFSTNVGLLGPSATSNNAAALTDTFNYDFANSPIIEGDGPDRTLKLQFDVSHFDPNEVTVSILDNKLTVSAIHEEKTDTSTSFSEYHREFHFPKDVKPETIVSSLSKDGVLVVQAPLPAIEDKSAESEK